MKAASSMESCKGKQPDMEGKQQQLQAVNTWLPVTDWTRTTTTTSPGPNNNLKVNHQGVTWKIVIPQ